MKRRAKMCMDADDKGESMTDIRKRTWAEIHLGRLAQNCDLIRGGLPTGCRFMGIVKADAYGHGAVPVAKRLEALGADYLAVSCFDEAMELRAAGIGAPILILGITPPELTYELVEQNLTQTVGDMETAREMARLLNSAGRKLRIHVKLDSGMGRLGFIAGREETPGELAELLAMACFEAEGVFTHFAVSDVPGDPFTKEQFAVFTDTVDAVEKETGHCFAIRHCANSGAVINYRELSCDMIRPGILAYGVLPGPGEFPGLAPVMELKTRVSAVTEHKKGDSVSYGRTFIAPRDMRLAVLPIGYADGLHRSLSDRMEVLIGGQRAKQVGRICMDMCMVDVTDLPGVAAGDEVTIFGVGLPVEEQAEKAGTIPYELICAVSKRVPRVYVD